MFCGNCGARITNNANFCDACGTQTEAEQARIQAQQEKNLQENPPAYLDVKTSIIITVILFIILPIVCWFSGVPLWLGYITAGVLSAICLIMGIRNQFFKK